VAINFQLALRRDVPGGTVLQALKDLAGGRSEGADELFLMPELWVGARPVGAPWQRETYQENWGIDVNTVVSFGLGYKFDEDNFRAARRLLSVSAARLADALDTDAGLSYELDQKMFHRQAGVLHLYTWWPEWTLPEVLEQLPAPYELTDDPGQL
jgi:hypothetical protein